MSIVTYQDRLQYGIHVHVSKVWLLVKKSILNISKLCVYIDQLEFCNTKKKIRKYGSAFRMSIVSRVPYSLHLHV